MFTRLIVIFALSTSIVCAADSPPTEASIKQLLELTNAHKLIDSTAAQMQAFMSQMMQQATQGRKISPEIQKDIDKRQSESMGIMKEMLDWNKLEPMYVRIYQKSLTQQDVDGMIGFYKTASGQALINKMPVIMQNTLSEMQQVMAPLMQRMRQDQAVIAARVKAESDKKS
jgi:uncharacterized protein